MKKLEYYSTYTISVTHRAMNKLEYSTYTKSVTSVLDENVSDTTVFLKKSFNVFFATILGQIAKKYSAHFSRHCKIKTRVLYLFDFLDDSNSVK